MHLIQTSHEVVTDSFSKLSVLVESDTVSLKLKFLMFMDAGQKLLLIWTTDSIVFPINSETITCG